jgi:hypothetical protein
MGVACAELDRAGGRVMRAMKTRTANSRIDLHHQKKEKYTSNGGCAREGSRYDWQ